MGVLDLVAQRIISMVMFRGDISLKMSDELYGIRLYAKYPHYWRKNIYADILYTGTIKVYYGTECVGMTQLSDPKCVAKTDR